VVGLLLVEVVRLAAASPADVASLKLASEEAVVVLEAERERLSAVDERVAACEVEMAKPMEQLQQLAGCVPVVDERCIVLKGLSRADVERAKQPVSCWFGEPSASGQGGNDRPAGRFLRCWQGKGRSDWNVVFEVSMADCIAFLKGLRS
jgi:hypothetical protein